MKPDESFLNQPIRSLQTMLRILAEQDPQHETLIPDGIYGSATILSQVFWSVTPVTGRPWIR